jgi:predicted HTH domain antitoxin
MTISFEIPRDIEHELNTRGADLSREAKEAFLVEQYRQRKISHHQLAQALGLDDDETDGVLKRRGITLELSVEELRDEAASLRGARPE